MSETDHSLLAASQDDLPAFTADLGRLVELETPSSDTSLLATGLDEIEAWLVECLGAPRERNRWDGGDQGDILEVRYPGTSTTEVLLVGHYDTVWPQGTLDTWPVRVEDDHFSGPGCLDMKAGLVQGVRAVRMLRDRGLDHPSVRFLFNGDEEIGSPASRPHIERASATAAATLVLEASAGGRVKVSRKGMGIFTVTTHGVESHAGLDPSAGASAVHALAEIIPALVRTAAPERGTTVNVGVVRGGTARNVVAGEASCDVDVRVSEPEEMSRIDAAFAELSTPDPRVKLVVDGNWNRPPMNPNPASEELLAHVRAAAADVGRELGTTAVGGASDANFVSALDRAVVCGLGAVGAGPHARHEHIVLSETAAQTAQLAQLLHRLA